MRFAVNVLRWLKVPWDWLSMGFPTTKITPRKSSEKCPQKPLCQGSVVGLKQPLPLQQHCPSECLGPGWGLQGKGVRL